MRNHYGLEAGNTQSWQCRSPYRLVNPQPRIIMVVFTGFVETFAQPSSPPIKAIV